MKKAISILLSMATLLLYSCKSNVNKNNQEQLNCWFNVNIGDSLIYRDSKSNTPMLIDYEKMIANDLCNIPNCSHTSTDCITTGVNAEEQLPVIYNNCAYYFINSCNMKQETGKNVLDLKCNIMKYDFNEMKTSKVTTIYDCNVDTSVSSILINSEYYFTTNYGNPKYDETGNIVSTSNIGGGNLMSINLDNNTITDYGEIFDYEKLKEEYPSAANSTSKTIVGRSKNVLYITATYRKEDFKISEWPEYYGKTYTFDLESKKIKFVDDIFTLSVSDDYIAYLLSTNNTKMLIKNTETDSIISGPHIETFNNISIFNDMVWYNSKCFNINKETEKFFSELSDAAMVAVYEDNYIISGYDDDGNIVFEKIPCEEIDSLFE